MVFTAARRSSYREQHTSDLLDGSETAEERHQADEHAGGDQDVGRRDVQVSAEELLKVRLVDHGPDADDEYREPSQLSGIDRGWRGLFL